MSQDLIAATVLFGLAALAGPPLAVAWWRHRGEHTRALAILAAHRATPTGPGPNTRPPDGGQPLPAAPAADLAEVIPLNSRRHAA